MTRAVIKLSNDIGRAMPRLSLQIEGCAYNPEAGLMAFPFHNMAVTVEPRRINIYNIQDETVVKTFIDWFKSIVNNRPIK
jgi:hypothetical protein